MVTVGIQIQYNYTVSIGTCSTTSTSTDYMYHATQGVTWDHPLLDGHIGEAEQQLEFLK